MSTANRPPAVLIFVRHPELGKVKTRLAATIGKEKALVVYTLLLAHTRMVVSSLDCTKYIFYAGEVPAEDPWKTEGTIRLPQSPGSLGEKMSNAFEQVLKAGHTTVVIIGSDCYDLSADTIEEAFDHLQHNDLTIGPARDGGYYLLGMNAPYKNVFEGIAWSTAAVYEQTLSHIKRLGLSVGILPTLTDIDTEEDITFNY